MGLATPDNLRVETWPYKKDHSAIMVRALGHMVSADLAPEFSHLDSRSISHAHEMTPQ